MTFTFIVKMLVRGFLVTFTHLQAIERHLGMYKAADAIQSEIELYDGYRREFL